jgi:hypothetical protein
MLNTLSVGELVKLIIGAYPKSGRDNGLVYNKVLRLHELLVATELPVHLCEMVLIHDREHWVNILKVIKN